MNKFCILYHLPPPLKKKKKNLFLRICLSFHPKILSLFLPYPPTPLLSSQVRGCLASVSKQQFIVFKQHFTYFHTLFHPHVFSQKFLNNNFQFLNTCTKQTLRHLKKKKGNTFLPRDII